MTTHNPLLDAAEHLWSAARFTRDAAAALLPHVRHTELWRRVHDEASRLERLMDDAKGEADRAARREEDTVDYAS